MEKIKEKLFVIGFGLGLIITGLTSCNKADQQTEIKQERFTNGYNSILDITTDKETGCKYIIINDTGDFKDIEPLLKADGTPDCE